MLFYFGGKGTGEPLPRGTKEGTTRLLSCQSVAIEAEVSQHDFQLRTAVGDSQELDSDRQTTDRMWQHNTRKGCPLPFKSPKDKCWSAVGGTSSAYWPTVLLLGRLGNNALFATALHQAAWLLSEEGTFFLRGEVAACHDWCLVTLVCACRNDCICMNWIYIHCFLSVPTPLREPSSPARCLKQLPIVRASSLSSLAFHLGLLLEVLRGCIPSTCGSGED